MRTDIPLESLALLPFEFFNKKWLILAAGDYSAGDYNCMTVSWGGLGTIWNRPLAIVFVRPTRHTFGFMETSKGFTLSSFTEDHRKKLSYCGSHSGRDGDKVKAAGLTPIACSSVTAPAFDEAELVLECRTNYSSSLDPARFLDPSIEGNYPARDYHRVYFGEILAASGTDNWRTAR